MKHNLKPDSVTQIVEYWAKYAPILATLLLLYWIPGIGQITVSIALLINIPVSLYLIIKSVWVLSKSYHVANEIEKIETSNKWTFNKDQNK